MTNNPNSHFIG